MSKSAIICIDDEADVLNSLKIELKAAFGNQYTIETADGGPEGLELLNDLIADNCEIVVIISDYIMPDMKGDELLKQAHILTPATLKIMLTGQANLEGITNAINQAQLYRYISKPWEAGDLILTVKEAIRSFVQTQKVAEQNRMLLALNTAYERFVPKEFLHFLGKESIVDARLGDQIHGNMTIMFSDIRSYTTLAEKMTPQEVFNFTNGYHNRMTPLIRGNGGFVQQFQGDGAVAVFPGEADGGLRAAIAIQTKVRVYNQERIAKNRQLITVGIGLHSGPLMIGIIGDDERWESGIPSDTVNTAARMEGLTKIYGAPIVISEATRAGLAVENGHHTRFLGKVQVKGKQDALSIYEVFDSDLPEIVTQKLATKPVFEEGLQLYFQKDFAEAAVCFKNVLKGNKEDKAAGLYLKQSAHFMINGAPEDWDGVEKLSQK